MSKRPTFRELVEEYGEACAREGYQPSPGRLEAAKVAGDVLLLALRKAGIPLDAAAPVSVEKASR